VAKLERRVPAVKSLWLWLDWLQEIDLPVEELPEIEAPGVRM